MIMRKRYCWALVWKLSEVVTHVGDTSWKMEIQNSKPWQKLAGRGHIWFAVCYALHVCDTWLLHQFSTIWWCIKLQTLDAPLNFFVKLTTFACVLTSAGVCRYHVWSSPLHHPLAADNEVRRSQGPKIIHNSYMLCNIKTASRLHVPTTYSLKPWVKLQMQVFTAPTCAIFHIHLYTHFNTQSEEPFSNSTYVKTPRNWFVHVRRLTLQLVTNMTKTNKQTNMTKTNKHDKSGCLQEYIALQIPVLDSPLMQQTHGNSGIVSRWESVRRKRTRFANPAPKLLHAPLQRKPTQKEQGNETSHLSLVHMWACRHVSENIQSNTWESHTCLLEILPTSTHSSFCSVNGVSSTHADVVGLGMRCDRSWPRLIWTCTSRQCECVCWTIAHQTSTKRNPVLFDIRLQPTFSWKLNVRAGTSRFCSGSGWWGGRQQGFMLCLSICRIKLGWFSTHGLEACVMLEQVLAFHFYECA